MIRILDPYYRMTYAPVCREYHLGLYWCPEPPTCWHSLYSLWVCPKRQRISLLRDNTALYIYPGTFVPWARCLSCYGPNIETHLSNDYDLPEVDWAEGITLAQNLYKTQMYEPLIDWLQELPGDWGKLGTKDAPEFFDALLTNNPVETKNTPQSAGS